MSQELVTKRLRLITEARQILNSEKVTNDDIAKANRMIDEADGIKHQLDADARAEAAERELRHVPNVPRMGQPGGFTSSDSPETRAFANYVLTGERSQELRTDANVNEGTPSSGGYFVPSEWSRTFEEALKAYGPMLDGGITSVIETAGGNPHHYPILNDTGNVGELISEEGGIGESVAPTFSEKLFQAYKISSKLLKVSDEFLQDNGYNAPTVLAKMLGTRIGRYANTLLTTGTGSGQPTGWVTAAYATAGNRVNMQHGEISAFANFDSLQEIIHTVDPAYRGRGCAWMMADSTAKVLAKTRYVDPNGTSNQYLWQPSTVAGQPDTLLGYPVIINQAMAALGASNKPILFGDPKQYIVRRAGTVVLKRLNELFAGNGQVGFIATLRIDGDSPSAAFGSAAVAVCGTS
jgi:HK97 family phage major capsid protein